MTTPPNPVSERVKLFSLTLSHNGQYKFVQAMFVFSWKVLPISGPALQWATPGVHISKVNTVNIWKMFPIC